MPSQHTIKIYLPNCVIDHADELAAFFFVSNLSSVGAAAFDRRVTSPLNPRDRFVEDDVRAINKTMMARTAYKHWAPITQSAVPPGWLRALDPSWDLVAMNDDDWAAAQCETRLLAALTAVIAPYRTTSIVTKLLHLKRPSLIPICDSYVCAMLGKHGGNATDTARLIGAVREVGRANLDALMEISRRLISIGVDRTPVRILDSLLWTGYQKAGPYAEFGRWITQCRDGRLFFQTASPD